MSGVTVSPKTASVDKGQDVMLTAKVAGTGIINQNVTWSITGAASSGTYVNGGKVHVAARRDGDYAHRHGNQRWRPDEDRQRRDHGKCGCINLARWWEGESPPFSLGGEYDFSTKFQGLLRNRALEPSYRHVRYYPSRDAQFNSIKAMCTSGTEDYTYQRMDNAVTVPYNAESLYGMNYCMFQNANYGSRWFYSFILRIEYVNPTSSRLYLQTDLMQTWFPDCTREVLHGRSAST